MSVRIIKGTRGDSAATKQYPSTGRFTGRLGEWLVQRGFIDRAELFTALNASYRHNCRLGDAVVWLELLDRNRLEAEIRLHARFANRRAASNMAG